MNKYQMNILRDELFCGGTAVSVIGGIIRFSLKVTYEEYCQVMGEIIRNTPSLRQALGRDKELYELPFNESFYSKHLVYNLEYEDFYREAQEYFKQPFEDIYDSPLFEFCFMEYRGGQATFLRMHHILGDAASIVVICKNISDGVMALHQGREFVCTVPDTVYRTIGEDKLKRATAYFDSRLKDRAPIVRMGNGRVNSYEASQYTYSLPLYKRGMLGDILAALYIFISNLTDSSTVVIGNVLGNRLKGEMGMIGMFANTLPMPLDFKGDTSFSQAVKGINNELFNQLKYSFYTQEDLREYNGINELPYEVSLSYKSKDFLPAIEAGEVIEMFNGCVDVPMRIFAEERAERLVFNVHYKNKLFSLDFVSNMCSSIAHILEQGMEDRPIGEIDILSVDDREAYSTLNSTKHTNSYRDVIECFKAHISGSEAVVWKGGSINYHELEAMSDSVAAYVREQGLTKVGVRIPRSYKLIASVLGILKAGAAFMVVSDVIPHMDRCCEGIIDEAVFDGLKHRDFTYVPVSGEATAYMVWTSGSTGSPKCIEISRSALMNRMEWAQDTLGFNCSILHKTVNTFDVSVWEMLSVIYGARLVILPRGDERLPDRIGEYLLEYGINMVHFVPSMLDIFVKYAGLKGLTFPDLRLVVASGEKLEPGTVSALKALSDAQLFNLYGPAECTIDVTYHLCDGGQEDVPIGRPVYNTGIYILNSRDKPLPRDVYGEICITGELVGKGYMDSPNGQGGYCLYQGAKAYKTGDIGRLGRDGNIYIAGRRDRQVKIRGMRVNLSEIKNLVLRCEGVTAAEIVKNNNRLLCYFSGDASVQDIKHILMDRLQAYAVPSGFIHLEEMPLTENGKADINALMAHREEPVCEDSLTPVEEQVLALVRRYAGEGIGVEDNVFDHGMDSLSVIELVCTLQEQGVSISFGDFYEGLCVRGALKAARSKRYYKYIKKGSSDSLIICLPYAGGEPQSFEGLFAKAKQDVIGVYKSVFDIHTSTEGLITQVISSLPLEGYKHIYIYGQCVGATDALEMADRLGDRVERLFLVAPSVRGSRGTGISPWEAMPDALIAHILTRAGGDKLTYSDTVLKSFRRDAYRYFKYKPRRYTNISCTIDVVFGSKDIFTKNSDALLRTVRGSVNVPVTVHYIEGGKHFMNIHNQSELMYIISGEI